MESGRVCISAMPKDSNKAALQWRKGTKVFLFFNKCLAHNVLEYRLGSVPKGNKLMLS